MSAPSMPIAAVPMWCPTSQGEKSLPSLLFGRGNEPLGNFTSDLDGRTFRPCHRLDERTTVHGDCAVVHGRLHIFHGRLCTQIGQLTVVSIGKLTQRHPHHPTADKKTLQPLPTSGIIKPMSSKWTVPQLKQITPTRIGDVWVCPKRGRNPMHRQRECCWLDTNRREKFLPPTGPPPLTSWCFYSALHCTTAAFFGNV